MYHQIFRKIILYHKEPFPYFFSLSIKNAERCFSANPSSTISWHQWEFFSQQWCTPWILIIFFCDLFCLVFLHLPLLVSVALLLFLAHSNYYPGIFILLFSWNKNIISRTIFFSRVRKKKITSLFTWRIRKIIIL